MAYLNNLENDQLYYDNRSLLFDLLMQEMSKSLSEKSDTVFKRIASMIDFKKTDLVARAWEELRGAVPEVIDKYTYLTNTQKENLLRKSILGDEAFMLTPKQNLEICREMSNVYDQYIDLDALFAIVSVKVNVGYTGQGLKEYWEKTLVNEYMNLPITMVEVARLDSIKAKTFDVIQEEENIINDIQDNELIEVTVEEEENMNDIIELEVVEEEKEETKPEMVVVEKETVIIPDGIQESDCIFKQVGEDEFEIIKGSIKLTKEDVLNFMNRQKSAVLDKDNKVLARNFF